VPWRRVIIRADARQIPLIDACVDCVITSPPYWNLRDYGNAGQIGLERSPDAYVAELVAVFDEVRCVLKDTGTVWLNIGDSYAAGGKGGGGSFMAQRREAAWQKQSTLNGWRRQPEGLKEKDLVGIPWRVAFALQADGWYLRSDIIWSKPNPMPESVTDRPTKAHEYLFLLSKQERYHYDAQAIAEPVSAAMLQQIDEGYDGLGLKDYEAAGVQNPSSVKTRIIANAQKRQRLFCRVCGAEGWYHHSQECPRCGEDADPCRCDRGGRIRERPNGVSNADAKVQPIGVNSSCGSGYLTRNRRTVWTVPTMPYAGAHFATMPEKLVEPCILAGCPMGGLVFDPFCGSGTVLAVAARLGRRAVGTDLSYQDLAKERTAQRGIPFGGA
jgi:DNA modification methylase